MSAVATARDGFAARPVQTGPPPAGSSGVSAARKDRERNHQVGRARGYLGEWVRGRAAMGSAILTLAMATAATTLPVQAAERAVVLEIHGVIGPAMADYVRRNLPQAHDDARLYVLRINTPGGLDTSMREIISRMLASPVPVAAYVAPSGARAASAGTYIVYAAAIAAMAPGTNIGAATPVQLGAPGGVQERKGDAEGGDAELNKIRNDALAYIRGLAELNGRNADWAAEAVRNAVSIPASEAAKLHVVNVVADDLPDLLRKIDGLTVTVAGKQERLATSGLEIALVPPDWRTELLAAITNPNVAFILMLVGVYGLIFEFFSPGAVAPGLIGSISLLVALFALNLLPISYAGAGLVLLGVGLMVAEAHIGAFGAIGIGGVIAFVAGAIMLFPSDVPGFSLSVPVLMLTTAATAAFFLFALSVAIGSRRRPVVTGGQALIGSEAVVTTWRGDEGRVMVEGETWRARARNPLKSGERAKVVSREGLTLHVAPTTTPQERSPGSTGGRS
jgi:membrane-bound serine protease (ClpP class)